MRCWGGKDDLQAPLYYRHMPAYRVNRLGRILYAEMIRALSALDCGGAFQAEWTKRKRRLPPTWNSYRCSSSRSKASKIASCRSWSVWLPRICMVRETVLFFLANFAVTGPLARKTAILLHIDV